VLAKQTSIERHVDKGYLQLPDGWFPRLILIVASQNANRLG